MTSASSPPSPSTKRDSLPAVDVLRGITILWVTLFHFFADTRGGPGRDVSLHTCIATLRSGDIVSAIAAAAAALAALPAFRVDLFLFVTGLVLMLSPPTKASAFLSRRLRGVLPSYWLGSLLVVVVIVFLASARAAIIGSGFGAEVERGSVLAKQYYLFHPSDIVLSFSVIGRFRDPRAMQVVAPSMWYVLLAVQAYFVFPMLRVLLARLGPLRFFLVTLAVTWLGRWFVFRYSPIESFGPNATVICFLPFRLAPLAAGMVAARWAESLRVIPRRGVSLGLAGPAVLLVLVAMWCSTDANTPGTTLGVIGPIPMLVLALPALWVWVAAVSSVPGLQRIFAWAGRHSISVLVAQDAMRFVVGTALALGTKLAPWTWGIAPVYLAASLALAWAWAPVPDWVGRRLWATGQSRHAP